jgi:hypothetical protein
LHHKCRKWIETLALQAEIAVSNSDITEQNYYRLAFTRKINDISQKDNGTIRESVKNITNKRMMNNNRKTGIALVTHKKNTNTK